MSHCLTSEVESLCLEKMRASSSSGSAEPVGSVLPAMRVCQSALCFSQCNSTAAYLAFYAQTKFDHRDSFNIVYQPKDYLTYSSLTNPPRDRQTGSHQRTGPGPEPLAIDHQPSTAILRHCIPLPVDITAPTAIISSLHQPVPQTNLPHRAPPQTPLPWALSPRRSQHEPFPTEKSTLFPPKNPRISRLAATYTGKRCYLAPATAQLSTTRPPCPIFQLQPRDIKNLTICTVYSYDSDGSPGCPRQSKF